MQKFPYPSMGLQIRYLNFLNYCFISILSFYCAFVKYENKYVICEFTLCFNLNG